MQVDEYSRRKLLNLSSLQDRRMLRGAWVRDKKLGDELMIIAVSKSQVYAGSRWITPYELYKNYEWLDGSPIEKESKDVS